MLCSLPMAKAGRAWRKPQRFPDSTRDRSASSIHKERPGRDSGHAEFGAISRSGRGMWPGQSLVVALRLGEQRSGTGE